MSKRPEERLWVAENGSIYVAEPDMVRSEFPGQKRSIPVRRAIAFNVGDTLAAYIVESHNARVSWGTGSVPFKLHDYGPRGQTTDETASWIGHNFLDLHK